MYRLYRILNWYTGAYATTDYDITFLFHDRRARPTYGPSFSAITAHASVECVMGRYFTPDALLSDRKQKYVMK